MEFRRKFVEVLAQIFHLLAQLFGFFSATKGRPTDRCVLANRLFAGGRGLPLNVLSERDLACHGVERAGAAGAVSASHLAALLRQKIMQVHEQALSADGKVRSIVYVNILCCAVHYCGIAVLSLIINVTMFIFVIHKGKTVALQYVGHNLNVDDVESE